jgi:hypothetical protein
LSTSDNDRPLHRSKPFCTTVTLSVIPVTRPSLALSYSVGMFRAQEASMNFNRHRYREDVLFVIALVIPAVLSASRYFETERQMTQIVRAQSGATEVALEARPAPTLDRIRSTLALQTRDERAAVRTELTPRESTLRE